jgi:outer membrane protein assembly complex protein YaeT
MGRITAVVQANGEAERWQDAQANLAVASLLLETPIGEVRNAGPLSFSYANRVLNVLAASLTAPESSLSVEGSLPLDESVPPGTVRYEAEINLAAIDNLSSDSNVVEGGGVARIEGELSGSIQRIRPEGRLTVNDGRLSMGALSSPLENVQLDAAIEGGQLVIGRLDMALGGGSISGRGSIPLGLFPLPSQIDIPQQSAPARFSLSGSQLMLDNFARVPEQINGSASFRLEAEATQPELNSVQATLTFDRLDLELAGVPMTPLAPPTISLRSGVLNVDQFEFRGPNSEIRLTGGAGVEERQLRDLRLNGEMDAALIGAFVDGLQTDGLLRVELAANGPWAEPVLNGVVEMDNGSAALASPRIAATELTLRSSLQGRRIVIETLRGDMNGGQLEITGDVYPFEPARSDLLADLDDVYLELSDGFRVRAGATLRLRPDGEFMVLDGLVLLQEGSYTQPLESQLLDLLRSGGGVEIVRDRDPLLERVRFDVAFKSDAPLVMDNNLGELALSTNLHLLGTYYRPGLTGRIEVEEGGVLFLQENQYVIERGGVTFANEARIEPLLDLVARTDVRDRNITMTISSGPDGIETGFVSDNPDDTRSDVIALLLTNRTAEELEGRELNAAGEQVVLSLFAGSLTGRVSRELQNTLGISTVRIAPNLISPESDPTARLTVGQDITNALEFIYSMNLANSSEQIWRVNYQVTPRLDARATKQDDNTYRFDFQHDVRWGQRAPVSRTGTASRSQQSVGAVGFTGNPNFPRETLQDRFKIEPGDRYDFFEVRKGIDRLESFYRDRDYLEAVIRLRRVEEGGRVNLAVEIEAGPQVAFVFEGWPPPGSVRKRIRELWEQGVFDAQRGDTSLAEIRRRLARDGYLDPSLEYEIGAGDAGRKRALFTVLRGMKYSNPQLVFDGAQGMEPDALRQALEKQDLLDAARAERGEAAEFLTRFYRQQGFLDAEVTGPSLDLNAETASATLRFAIQEGPRYRWGRLNVDGATAYTIDELREASGAPPGEPYSPQAAQDSRDKIEEAFWRKGFRDVVVDYALVPNRSQGTVDANVIVQEGPRSVVEEVVVQGTDRTSPEFVKNQLELAPGDVLDFTKTASSRRGLYNTGAFSSVEVRTEPVGPNVSDPAALLKPVRLVANVQERVPFQVRYGGFFDTERGPGFIADFWNRNSLGGGRVLGFRTRYDGNLREGRVFFSQPSLRSLPLQNDATFFVRRELREDFITDRVGTTFQQEVRLANRFLLNYGYRYERAHTFDRVPDEFLPFDESLRIAPLTATINRDVRDEILDATRGSFTSHSFELGTRTLGSDLRFVRYFGQYFHYLPLTDPAPVPFGGGQERPRLVYAGGVRVGLAKGLGGQELVRSERFFAGGGTTIRGFKQDQLGPRDFLDEATGGDAVLIVNNELRFPAFKMFDGVGFLDLGNVYESIGDFSFTGIRKTAGAGLRVRTPYLMLRFDYGFKLDRQPGEPRGTFFFSIGQAF